MTQLHDDREARRLEKKQREHAKQIKGEIDAAIKANLEHRNGRRLLWWLLQIGRAIGENPFATNALQMSFKCGEQNVGLQVLDRITEVDPDGFINMMKEQRDERRTLDSRDGLNRDDGNADGTDD